MLVTSRLNLRQDYAALNKHVLGLHVEAELRTVQGPNSAILATAAHQKTDYSWPPRWQERHRLYTKGTGLLGADPFSTMEYLVDGYDHRGDGRKDDIALGYWLALGLQALYSLSSSSRHRSDEAPPAHLWYWCHGGTQITRASRLP